MVLKVTDVLPGTFSGQEREWVKTISPPQVSHLEHFTPSQPITPLPSNRSTSPLLMNGGLMKLSR